jgi:IS1 family transposase
MNRLPLAKRVAVISALVEGCSVRSTSRLTGVAKGTILRLLADVGDACAEFHDKTVRNLKCRRIQCDEIWSFVGAKQKHATEAQQAKGWGDLWTWTGLDADTKLMVSYLIGPRTPPMAYEFVNDLAARVNGRTQLTTDGLYWYVDAVDHAFGTEVDYAMLQKHYGGGIAGERSAAARYSSTKFNGATKEIIKGDPNPRHISTSYVERQNLTMRMNMRRFTRLTNAFGKKVENHAYAVALFYMHYNFARVHQTLRVTPAMESGIATHVWSIQEIVALMEPASETSAA